MATKPRLRPCVDCGNNLSPTATQCGQCNSTDPFGTRRAEEKFKLIMIGLIVVVVLAGVGAYKWKGITPVDVIHGDFHKLWQSD